MGRAEMNGAIGHNGHRAMMIGRLGIVADGLVSGGGAGQELHRDEEDQENSGDGWLPAGFAQPFDCLNPLHCSVSETNRTYRRKRNSCKRDFAPLSSLSAWLKLP